MISFPLNTDPLPPSAIFILSSYLPLMVQGHGLGLFLNGLQANPPIYLHLIFEILQFEISSLMNWIFTGCVACKNPVQTRKKNQVHQT